MRLAAKPILVAVFVGICCTSLAQNADWPIYGGQPEADHYSGLSQVNRGNVGKLKLAWRYDAGEKGGLETSPLIVDRLLYGYTATSKVIALDAATGQLVWQFDPGFDGNSPERGLTYWTNGNERRLFASVTNFLYALNARTGQPIRDFGEDGRIDLRKDLRGEYRLQSVQMTSPGIIYRDLIIIGGRNPESHPAPPGDIRAFDVHTGALKWRFHTIPHPGEFGYDTWPKDAWTYSGAANNWAGMSLDEGRGIVYIPTGSATFDFYGADRVGDNLFADTLLALDASTGKRIWHFQGVHHDLWDRDFPAPPALVTLKRNGKWIDAAAQVTKQGYLFVFDRVNGRSLFPIEERAVPKSQVPGEVTSPTQPIPLAPPPFARQILTEDMLTQRTPSAHAWAEKNFSTYLSGGQFVPTALDRETIVFPCFLGGAEWGGPAVDPRKGILYINSNEAACVISLTQNNPGRSSTGERTYHNQCSICHGDKRTGSPPTYPSLVGVGKRLSRADIENTILHGKGRMPAFPALQGDYMQALINFLNTSSVEPGNASSPIGHASTHGEDPQTHGAKLYQDKCATCHGEHREGKPPAFPSLQHVGQRFLTDQILDRIRHGRGLMPAFSSLSEEDVSGLLAYLTAQNPVDADPDRDALYSSTAEGAPMKYRITGSNDFLDPEGYPGIKPPWGTLNAIDLNTGKYLWRIPLGEYPELVTQGLTNTGTDNYGGPIVTAGHVVFIGASVYDKKFRAFDSRTGKLLWQTTLPNSGVATPVTYMIDGKQYIVIAAGGGKDPKSSSGSVYEAFSLP